MHIVFADYELSDAESDWLARSTGAGVIWAHDFRNDAEYENFARTQTADNPLAATLAATPFGSSRAIQSKGYGTTFAANASGGQTTFTLTSVASFPDPATVGSYSLYCGEGDNGIAEEVLVTAINYGTNQMTVTRGVEGDGNQAYTAGVGTIGRGSPTQWRRPFAALPAGQNGLASDDRGITTALVTERDWTGFGNAAANWAFYYGYYGHSSYHNSTFDGDEFWIQWRSKIHANRFSSQRDSKFWYLQKVAGTTDEQFFGAIRDSSAYDAGRWTAPEGWAYDSGATAGGTHVRVVQDHGFYYTPGDYQEGGLYGASCVSSGGVCYLYAPDVWTTWMLHVKPGRAGVAETVVELFAATEGETSFTTVLSVSDYTIPRYDDVAFDYQNSGYNSFWPQNYGNDYVGSGSVAPSIHDTLVEYTQIIFSQQAIACPGATVSASKNVTTSAGSIAVAGQAPARSVAGSQSVTTGVGALAVAGKVPSKSNGAASALQTAADSLSAGDWVELTASGDWPGGSAAFWKSDTATSPAPSESILAYANCGVWNATLKKVYFLGDGYYRPRWVEYDEATDTWSQEEPAFWSGGSSSHITHIWDHAAWDETNQVFYGSGALGSWFKYTVGTDTWASIAARSMTESHGTAYFEDISALVTVDPGGTIYKYDAGGNSWSTYVSDSYGYTSNYHVFAEYDPIRGQVYFGGGNLAPRALYKLTDVAGTGTVTALTSPSSDLLDHSTGCQIVCDPVTGNLIVKPKTGTTMYEYDPDTDSWSTISTTIPAAIANKAYSTAIPISTHGVIMYIAASEGSGAGAVAYLYKHA